MVDDSFRDVRVDVHGAEAHLGEGGLEDLDVPVDVLESLDVHLPAAGVVVRVKKYIVVTFKLKNILITRRHEGYLVTLIIFT